MSTANHLIGVGLAVILVALAFEFLSMSLSPLAVGAGLIVIGLMLLGTKAMTGAPAASNVACPACGSSQDPDTRTCDHCGAEL